MDRIDFVVTWVDGSDPEWRNRRLASQAVECNISTDDANANGDWRYCDRGLLKYWFRAVEKFAPWARRVYLVTCGQKPAWLDEDHPKLRFVSHEEYIPEQWLPTFHSNTIELNLHRIEGLSERFVLFNDDMFLLRPVSPEFYFRRNLPVTPCDLGIPRWMGANNISRIAFNNSGLVRLAFNVERQVWRNWRKFFGIRSLGLARAAKNLMSIAVNRITFHGCFGHIPLPHLKSTFEQIWSRFGNALERTSRHRFRADDCVNHWLGCAWNLAAGRFTPVNEKRMGRYMAVTPQTVDGICAAIRGQTTPQLSLGDGHGDLTSCFDAIVKAFDDILPDKSQFEI